MTIKLMSKISMVIFLLVLFLNFNAFAQTDDCSKTKDADIAASIKMQIKKKYGVKVANRIKVSSKNRVVRLRGKFRSKNEYRRIAKIASQTNCVKSVKSNLSCPAGYMECPDGTCKKSCGR